jgi:hypothetical protein
MDPSEEGLLEFWKRLNENNVRYIHGGRISHSFSWL